VPSGLLYDRVAKLVIAPIDGSPGVELTGLRVTFDIEKTSVSQPNKSNVKIYNLAPQTRKRIRVKKQAIMLSAGYVDMVHLICSGVIQRVEHSCTPPDVMTELELRDGGLGLDDMEFRKSFKPGTSRMQIVREILATMPDVNVGALVASGLAGVSKGKLSFSGKARRALDKLARAWDLEWSVQDGSVQILDHTGTTKPKPSALVLSPETGMVGTPTLTEKGVKVRSLLMPALKPGEYIEVRSSFVSGWYKALSVHHTGDTHGDDWHTEVEAKSLLGPAGQKKSKGKKK